MVSEESINNIIKLSTKMKDINIGESFKIEKSCVDIIIAKYGEDNYIARIEGDNFWEVSHDNSWYNKGAEVLETEGNIGFVIYAIGEIE